MRILPCGGTFAAMFAADYREIFGDGRSGESHWILRQRRWEMRVHAGARGLRPGSEQEREKQNTPHYHAAHISLYVSLTI